MWTLVVLTGHWQWTLGVLTGPWQCECFVCVEMSLTVWTLGVCWQVIDSVNPKCVDRSLTVWMFCLCWQITDSVNALCWWVTDSVNALSVLIGHWLCDCECFFCVDRSLTVWMLCVDGSLTVWLWMFCLCWWVTDSVTMNALSVLTGHWLRCRCCLATWSVACQLELVSLRCADSFHFCLVSPAIYEKTQFHWFMPDSPSLCSWDFDWSLRTVLGIEKDTWIAV